MSQASRIEIVAHRGYSARAPENTLAALEAALEVGVGSLEFDVQPAACGTPVLFHDAMLGRTTNGVGPLGRRPLAHLKALDAGSWFGPEFAGEPIPTLREALERVTNRATRLYQDIKSYRELEDLDRIAHLTEEVGAASRAVFISSDWIVMNRLRQVAPAIQRAYLVAEPERLGEAIDRAAVDEGSLLDLEIGVALEHPEAVHEALQAGVEVMVWTVDDPELASRAVELGITRITSNEVERMLAWRDSLR